jgi:hypothetical protein
LSLAGNVAAGYSCRGLSPGSPARAARASHGGSGRYVFLGPDGGHYRRSNYARRVFRPACDGRHEAKDGRPPKLVIADATIWPGVPIAAWPPADPSVDYAPPRGRGIQAIRDGTPSPAGSRSSQA